MLGGEEVGVGDADDSQLRMLAQQLGHGVAVAPHLQQLADGQAGVVAERFAAHDERIHLHPLDRHVGLRLGVRRGDWRGGLRGTRSDAAVHPLPERIPPVAIAGKAAVALEDSRGGVE